MVECMSCGSVEFQFLNAGYYCIICHTLSQDHGLATQQEDEAVFDGYTHGAKINLRKVHNKDDQAKHTSDLGRPWRSHEAFQYVLKEQVHDLISLGVDPEIKNVVFRLWMRFLQKYGLAFLTDQPTPEKAIFKNARQRNRDKYPGTIKDPVVKSVYRRKNTSVNQDSVGDEESFQVDESDSSLEKPKDDYCLLVLDEKQNDQLLKCLKGSQTVHDDEGVLIANKVKCQTADCLNHWYNDKLSLISLLGILYAALQYVNNRVLPHDLVRWIKACKLQFNRTNFPENMKFFQQDHHVFHSISIPTPNRIVEETAIIAKFLGLKNFPEVDVTSIAHRFISELGLPGELHTIVANLIQLKQPSVYLKNSFSGSFMTSVNFACLTMAYIIITIKMVLGLDDVTEWKLSEYAQILSSFIDFAQPLFNWSDWVSYMEQQISNEHAHCFPKTLQGAQNVEVADTVFNLYDMQNSRFNQYCVSRFYSNTQIRTRKTINEFFKDMYNKSVKRRMPSYNEEQEQFNNNFDESGCSESILSRKKELCQNSTLQYIVDPQTFIDNLGKSHDKVDDEGDFLSTCSNDEEAMDYELELNSSLDLFANHQHKYTRGCEMQRHCNRLKKPGTTLDEILQSLPLQPAEFPKPYENYILFQIPTLKDSRKLEPCMKEYPTNVVTKYESYSWLVKACSSHVIEETIVLEQHIQKLELILFSELTELNRREDYMRSMFMKRCFPRMKTNV